MSAVLQRLLPLILIAMRHQSTTVTLRISLLVTDRAVSRFGVIVSSAAKLSLKGKKVAVVVLDGRTVRITHLQRDAIVPLTMWLPPDRLLNNPWAQPPLPSDWEVHPTYPKHSVPYYLAPLWDQDMAVRADAEKKKRELARKHAQISDASTESVPRELREKLKKAKAAKGLLRDLEEQVRLFVEKWEATASKDREEPELDSEDEEIVFVGRNGQMNDMPPSPQSKTSPDKDDIERDRLVFESLANDQGASFG